MTPDRPARGPGRIAVVTAVARRELAAYFSAPIAYVVGVLFLVIEGLSFWAVVKVLSDPTRPAPYGAVMRTVFGGTFLYWAVLFVVVAVIAMRLVADEKRQGTWESLLTTPAGEGSILVGKWLGAVAFYAALWVPTLAYVFILARHLPADASFDAGPIVASYVGVLVTGAGFLSIGLAASATTSNQIIAAVTTFVVLLAVLVVGELPQIAPGWFAAGGGWRALIHAVGVRGHMQAFARGAIDVQAVAFYAGIAALSLALAELGASVGRRRRRALLARITACGLIAAIAVLGNVLLARHPRTIDMTRSGINTLSERTRSILRGLDRVPGPVRVVVVRPSESVFDPVYAQVDRLLARMARAQPRLERSDLDPARQPQRAAEIATEFAIVPKDLAEGGAVVFRVGKRSRAVDLLDMAGFDYDDLGVGEISQFKAEQAFASALLELESSTRPTVCYTTAHGELPLAKRSGGADWGAIAGRLARDAVEVEDVGAVAGGVPKQCAALVVAGPERPLSADEAQAVAAYLHRGGRLLVALAGPRSGPDGASVPKTGLAVVLADYGISLPRAVVVDPAAAIDLPGAFAIVSGYGDHPISAPFRGRRTTVWQRPRAIVAGKPAGGRVVSVLARSSQKGRGAADIAAVAAGKAAPRSPQDVPGPVAVAVAAQDNRTGARLVVVGSARSLSSALGGRGFVADQAFGATAIAWLVGRVRAVDIGAKTPEHIRLIMTSADLARTFVVCVILLPLALALAGGVIAWRRRRR